ncbi:transcription initiation factor TFIID subunit 12-like [Physella acuta]|uniref:transcription initiation factor TFIID subunit 12-like n=1 Tax=Physella acuta TaxID=109671 RepID=UPI0027DC4CFB|nr:transcription initiation factor TFIID subunit 12-like [Physella acuta]
MSSFQNLLNTTTNGHPGTSSPNPSTQNTATSNSTAIMNIGPMSSPIIMATNSSPIMARSQQSVQSMPEQIIVPVGNVMGASKLLESRQAAASQAAAANAAAQGASGSETKGVLDKSRLRDLVKEVDPLEQMDDDVEDVLLQVADDFIENVVAASCQLAKHRRSNTLEAKDVQLYLERNWNIQIPGFGSEEIRPYKKSITTEAHKQRMALIRKTLKRY